LDFSGSDRSDSGDNHYRRAIETGICHNSNSAICDRRIAVILVFCETHDIHNILLITKAGDV
jgi:hypothetical protein